MKKVKDILLRATFLAVAIFLTSCATPGSISTGAAKKAQPGITGTKEIAGQSYIYGFPMIAGYKAMYQFNINKDSGQYKGAFNTIVNDSRIFTPTDTAIVRPNNDTPCSMIQADLRAQPIVLCMPEVESNRYYSVQLCDMYSVNYGYIGSRATGNSAGCYLVAGPDWKGTIPPGIRKVFRCETQFGLIIYRTQLFGPSDMANVKKIQSGYIVQTLAEYLHQRAPPAPPAIKWFPFTDNAFKMDFAKCLDFLLQFCPAVPQEMELRAKFASIGIGPGKKFNFNQLDYDHKFAAGQAVKNAYAKIEEKTASLGKDINGWRVSDTHGGRAFYNGDWLLRAAAVLDGIYGNDSIEAIYFAAKKDISGQPLDGSKHDYILTFPAGQLPPVNAFWSLTMYDGKTQLLIENPVHRYLINSSMLPGMKKNGDGSLTIYIQKDSPGAEKEDNWLPAPDDPIYLVMRLYWPKVEEPSILPAGEGTWKSPGIVKAN